MHAVNSWRTGERTEDKPKASYRRTPSVAKQQTTKNLLVRSKKRWKNVCLLMGGGPAFVDAMLITE